MYAYDGHGHGGKFDGNCYVDSGINPVGAGFNHVMCRFKIDPSATTTQNVFGTYNSAIPSHYRLQIMYSGGVHYLRIRYASNIFAYSDFPLDERIYNAEIYDSPGSSYLKFTLTDSGGNILYRAIETTTGSGTSPNNFYVGAVNYRGSALEKFKGKIYSWYCYTFDTVTAYKTKLVFIENYNDVSSGYVADYYSGSNGIIYSRPDDFWPSKTDISSRVHKIGRPNDTTTKRGSHVTPKLTFYTNDLELEIDDVVTIENDGSIDFCYVITEKEYTYDNEWYYAAVHPFALLENIVLDTLVESTLKSIDNFYINYTPDGGDTLASNRSVRYYLKAFVYALEMDAILGNDVTGLPTTSRYFDYRNSQYIPFADLLYNDTLFDYFGTEESTTKQGSAMMLLDAICDTCRLTHHLKGGDIVWEEISHAQSLISNDDIIEKPRRPKYVDYKSTEVTVKIIPDASLQYPDLSGYAVPFDSNDLVDNVSKDTFENIANMSYDRLELPANFWLYYNDSGAIRTMYYTAGSQRFTIQLKDILNAEFKVRTKRQNYKLKGIVDFAAHLKSRTVDFENLTTEITEDE